METIHLYNSLTRKIEELVPVTPGRIAIYACGPTVWNYAHLGNFRTFLLGDLLRRYLEYLGYEVFQVMNLTDVDDRTIRAANEVGSALRDYTTPFVRAFFEDRDYLRIEPADVYPRATEYVEQMVSLVEQLIKKGLAYTADDGSVYFAVDRFAGYGRLSQVERRELQTGARVASDEYAKEDARDFALWKSASAEDERAGAAWDAPFGRGRPGWHLECSAMALAEVEQRFGVRTLDIHVGGVDLIFPHHENEIAQSEGATGEPFAQLWMHGEFLLMEGTKMSKRFGNLLTVRDLKEEGVDPAAARMLMFSTHYRQQLNLTDNALGAATEGIARIGDVRKRLVQLAGNAAPGECAPAVEMERDFRAAMNDDLNAPQAVGAIFSFVRAINRDTRAEAPAVTEGYAAAALAALDRVLEVTQLTPGEREYDSEFVSWVEERIRARSDARKASNFGLADDIRAELAARGVELEDSPAGTSWKVRG
ncbi:MAG: cysteine--tRNA ligase [Gemmatimonadales bacterium]